jgi:hypothetical protein
MLNKKSATGIHWELLLFAFIIALGILFYSLAKYDFPKVGEYSTSIISTAEKYSRTYPLMEGFMGWINKNTHDLLDENKIFELRSFCENDAYKERVREERQLLTGGFGQLEGNNSFCVIDEDDLVNYFEMLFEGEYDDFKSQDLSNIGLDLSDTIYTSSVKKEDDGNFNIVNASLGISIPVETQDKEIGKLVMEPVFNFPVDYAFDDPEKEICILSVSCDADCDDVIEKYPETGFRKKNHDCNDYFFCTDAFIDDFGLEYPCEANFCMQDPESFGYCSNAADDTVCPDCCCTPWVSTGCGGSGCSSGERGYTRECKLSGCDTTTKCEGDPCCRDPICCEQYPPACDCGSNICCTPDPSLCPSSSEPGPGNP